MKHLKLKDNYEVWKATLDDGKLMTKREYVLSLAVAALGGIVIGMLLAPKKNSSKMIGCNTTNTNHYGDDDDCCCGVDECGCDCDGDCECGDECCCGEPKDSEECFLGNEKHCCEDEAKEKKEYVKIK